MPLNVMPEFRADAVDVLGMAPPPYCRTMAEVQASTAPIVLTNYERVSDHCSNLAVAMIELESDAFDTHQYMISLKQARSHGFDRYYAEYRQKFSLPGD